MKKIFVMMLMVAFATLSQAQSLTKGEIYGYVTDDAGTELPGVTIQITSDSLQGSRSTVTNEKGFFRFPLLPVGEYKVVFSMPGFQTLTQNGVMSKVGEKTRANGTMRAESLEESIIITAEAPLIDTSTTDTSVEMDSETLAAIPTLSRSIEDVAKFTPGVTGVRIDVVNGGENGMPNIRGAGQEGSQYVVDGTSVRSSMGFSNNVPQNFDTIETLQIISDPFSPEFGKTTGGAINAVTKSGGNEFHGEAGLLWRDSSLQQDKREIQNPSSITGFSRNRQWYNMGGYIIKDKLWFFVSHNYTKASNKSSGAADRVIDAEDLVYADGTPFGSDYVLYEYNDGVSDNITEQTFAKLTYNINENMNLAFSGLELDNTFTGKTGHHDMYLLQERDSSRYKLNYNWIIGDFGVLEINYQKQEDDFISGGLTDRNVAQRVNTTIAWAYGNLSRYDNQYQEREDFNVKFKGYWETDHFGSHEFALGYVMEDYTTDWLRGNTGMGESVKPAGADTFNEGVNFSFEYLQDASGNIIVGADGRPIAIPSILQEQRNSINNNNVESTGMFFQDRITYGNWTVMLGLRMDEMTVFDDLGNPVWEWGYSDFLSPRLSVIYDLGGEQTNIFKFAYGEFRDATTTRIAEWFNQQGGNSYREYNWGGPMDRNVSEAELHDASNWGAWVDGVFYPGQVAWEQSPDTAPMDFDENIKPNLQKRWMVEYNRRLNPNHAMVVRYSKAWATDLIEDIGIMADTPSGYRFYLTNYEDKRRDYESIDLEFKGSVSDWFDYAASYTWTDSKGTNPGNFENETLNNAGGSGNYVGVFGDHIFTDGTGWGDFLDAYTAGLGGRGHGAEGWYGKLSDASDHMINFVGNFHLPKDFHITLTAQWVSGFYWTKKGYQQNYHGYFAFVEGRGSRTTPSMQWIDLSVTKNFKVWYGHDIELRVDIFNLLNGQQPIQYVEEDTVDFGKVFDRQQPRAVQFGVKYKF